MCATVHGANFLELEWLNQYQVKLVLSMLKAQVSQTQGGVVKAAPKAVADNTAVA